MLVIWEGVEANQEGLGPHWVWYSGGLQMVSGIQPGESGIQLNMAVYTGVWSVQCTCIIQLYTYTGVLAETLRLPMALIHRYQTHTNTLGATKDTMADKIILFSLVLGAVNISICLTGRASMRNT